MTLKLDEANKKVRLPPFPPLPSPLPAPACFSYPRRLPSLLSRSCGLALPHRPTAHPRPPPLTGRLNPSLTLPMPPRAQLEEMGPTE